MGPMAGQGGYGEEKLFCPYRGSKPRISQPVASRCADYAVRRGLVGRSFGRFWVRPSALCLRCLVSVLKYPMPLSRYRKRLCND